MVPKPTVAWCVLLVELQRNRAKIPDKNRKEFLSLGELICCGFKN